MSIVSGTVGGVLNAEAQKDANATNRANAQETNALNLQQFNASRGKGGAAVLPTYLRLPSTTETYTEMVTSWEPQYDGGQTITLPNGKTYTTPRRLIGYRQVQTPVTKTRNVEGKTFESAVLGRDLMDMWTGTFQKPEDAISSYQGIVDRFKPMQDAAEDAAADIFDGSTTNRLLENFNPVAEGRVQYARQSAVDALGKTLQAIEAAQSQKGFVGDSSANRTLRFQANKAASDAVAGVNLANLEEERGIKDRGELLRLENLGLPGQMTQSAIQTARMPVDTYIDQTGKALQPLTFLRIGQGQPYQYSPMPTVNPVASIGQSIAAGGAAAGNLAAKYYLDQQSAKNAQNLAKAYTGANAFSSPSSLGLNTSLNYNTNAANAALSGVGAADYGGLGLDTSLTL